MLRFGTGGSPISTKQVKDENGKNLSVRESAIYRLEELKLDHIEQEFVHGVRIKEEDAKTLGKLSEEKGITQTIHGSYYINLSSKEEDKREASVDRVYKAMWAGRLIKAKSVTFHAAYYQDLDRQEVSDIVKEGVLKMFQKFDSLDNLPLLSIETPGKVSQWGDVEEILKVADEINQKHGKFTTSICIDFAHLHARTNGEINDHDQFINILNQVENVLEKESLEHLHMHMSGINYSEKGERNHLNLEKADLNYKKVLQALIDKNVSGWLVCESPNLEIDAKIMKEEFKKLGGKTP
jgi:deoxyribonuclease-4